jgi:predicted nucleic acid-binding Zn ribbon protein
MKRGKDLNMKEAIDQLLEVYKLRQKFDETSLVAAWPSIIGQSIANRTKQVYVKDRRLYVRVESAVIKQELTMLRTLILARLNEHVGQVIVDDMVIL